MTISSGVIKRNMTILLQDEIYQIIEWQHRQAPQAPPTLTLKLRHIQSGNVYEKKVPGNQKLQLAQTENREAQYLYQDKDLYVFMDNENFEQYELTNELIGDSSKFLSELSLIHLSIKQLPGPISLLVILKFLSIFVIFAIPPIFKIATGTFNFPFFTCFLTND